MNIIVKLIIFMNFVIALKYVYGVKNGVARIVDVTKRFIYDVLVLSVFCVFAIAMQKNSPFVRCRTLSIESLSRYIQSVATIRTVYINA